MSSSSSLNTKPVSRIQDFRSHLVESFQRKYKKLSKWIQTYLVDYPHLLLFRGSKLYRIAPTFVFSTDILRLPFFSIKLGICAMKKKVQCETMQYVLKNLDPSIQVIIFDEEMFLHEDISVSQWPKCDAFISFYSSGFPLHKAEEYVKLVQPYCINDLPSQNLLRDRRHVYEVLKAHGVPIPTYFCVNRTKEGQFEKNDKELIDEMDFVQMYDIKIQKPCVEKPVDADDHNVWVHYANGQGRNELFRKKNNESSKRYLDRNGLRKQVRICMKNSLKPIKVKILKYML